MIGIRPKNYCWERGYELCMPYTQVMSPGSSDLTGIKKPCFSCAENVMQPDELIIS